MSLGKTSRVTNGPYANWGADDEIGVVNLANGSSLVLGQPLSIDVTQLGPDQNVPNNGALPPQCEYLVATNSANAGPLFGVLTGISAGLSGPSFVAPKGFTGPNIVNGLPTWTNNTGASIIVPVSVRQLGWAYVWAGTAAIGQTGGNSIKVGDTLVTTTAQQFGIQGTAGIGSTIGFALGTAVNTKQGGGNRVQGQGAPAGPGVVSVVPLNMAGIVPGTIVLIDSLASGVQEAVSVGSVSLPTFSIALANAHAAGFAITGPASNPSKGSVLISTPGAGATYSGLIAAYVDIQA